MTNDERIDSLEQRVHILSLTTQGDNSHQLSAIESKLATVSKTLAEVKNSIPQSGPSLATIKDLIEKTVAKTYCPVSTDDLARYWDQYR